MNSFRTEVTIGPAERPLRYDDAILFMGSCFASNMGGYFSDLSLNVMLNPFGVLYNPSSIANGFERLLNPEPYRDRDVFQRDGLYHTFFHHSSFNSDDKSEFIKGINHSLQQSSDFLRKAKAIVITFGTAWVYRHNELDMVVANCHKYSSGTFTRQLLSVNDVLSCYRPLLTRLRQLNPALQLIFTLSPVRHWKDGAHGNQLSKASLLLAIDQLVKEYDQACYFPAYELLLDELRDYRFYADDMLHPSKQAIAFIRSKFVEAHFDGDSTAIFDRLAKLRQASQHRPFNRASAAHQSFVRNHIQKVDTAQKQFPGLDLTVLRKAFEAQVH
ncbi:MULTISPECIES: GSCFA domain-containing protein [unclassified Carboxylicivirga]|uniref:GSCFA domain-containing protein n=1 Tax=Carboxylicivirga TaxID=1628153 RepID=UPI003D32E8A8